MDSTSDIRDEMVQSVCRYGYYTLHFGAAQAVKMCYPVVNGPEVLVDMANSFMLI